MTVIWITGLSGVGKTTLANALKKTLREKGKFVIQFDGDEVRTTINNDLGYGEDDRIKHITRIQKMAKFIGQQDAIVIVSALYFDESIAEWNRKNYSNYIEVYIEASLKLLQERDQKCIYSRFAAKQISNVVGLDIPYSSPKTPDFIFFADDKIDPNVMVYRIMQRIYDTKNILALESERK